jgi:hypothetical protein
VGGFRSVKLSWNGPVTVAGFYEFMKIFAINYGDSEVFALTPDYQVVTCVLGRDM